MELYQIILLVIISPIILYIIYTLIFLIGYKIIGYKDNFENDNQVTTTAKIYKSNRSKCFSCEKQDPDSFHTPCFSCNKNIKYPDENNMPGRYLQR